jgi:riboflavin synthase
VFTGLVEAVGTVSDAIDGAGSRRITIRAPEIAPELRKGDSVAVDGACLTAVDATPESFAVDVVGTTLSRTVTERYQWGTRVNLERALRLGDRLDGHMVQGHVDAVGALDSVVEQGTYRLMHFRIPPEVESLTILHGSIAINGVSLTVNALHAGICQVAIIPHTWEHTNLRDLSPGDPVNLEGDLIGKYVARMVSAWALPMSGQAPRT